MPDREKYIEVLSKAVKTVKEYNEDAPIRISLKCIEDILELLKEQDARIDQLNRFVNGFSKEAVPVVRCKDCEHHLECDYWIENGDDWFCADGKRKEGR